MAGSERQVVVVTVATALPCRPVARHLLKEGWQVRGLTRHTASRQEQRLAALGADVVQDDMNDAALLLPVFAGTYGVYSVQNPFLSGPEAEIT